MSNKATGKPKAGLTPKLRFPEFRDEGEWVRYPFDEFVDKSFYGTSSSTSPTGQYPVLRMGNMVDGGLDFSNLVYIDLDRNSFESFRLANGDILLNRTNSPALVGKISIFLREAECMTASYIVAYRLKKDRIDPLFCNLILNTPLYQKRIKTFAKPSISQANINPTTLRKELIICVPEPGEQQKIAACLTSLDEVIASQSQKLEALKTHKKGLMQQLFPREGETVPRLRFPEFRDAEGWEIKPLDQVATYENGKAHENNISEQGKYVVVNSKFISTEGAVQKYSNEAFCPADAGDILMVLSDVPNGRAIAKCFLVDSDNSHTVNQRICILRPQKANGRFLFYILDRNPFFLAFDDGVKQTNLRKEDVLNCPLCLPFSLNEQQRIANCLTSLDDLITAQSAKVEILKTHKKGLMQQLFPSPEKAEA
jgi:type I restriction enzyme S subunit